jgi:membrane protease YdiL (CAAX protease family)
MTLFDDNVSGDPPQNPATPAANEQFSVSTDSSPLAGDPISYAASTRLGVSQRRRNLPEDLRVSWSWPHFVVFVFFGISSFALVQTALAIHYAPHRRLSQKQLEDYLLSKPQFLFGSNVLWYALIFLFLYVTLAVLRNCPFWSSLGWKKLKRNLAGSQRNPWTYFLSGCALAVFVFIASAGIHGNENMPIQEILNNRNSAILLMAMAVLIAPLVEETVFRGYLYPLFAKSFGIGPGIVVTGVLFGLMHGAQLGWTWGIVALLILVGIVFTAARAYTGTVLASFLLHLGYNSMIAAATIISTHGFTHMPLGR